MIKIVQFLFASNLALAAPAPSLRPEVECVDARGPVAVGSLELKIYSGIGMAGEPSPRKYMEIAEKISATHVRALKHAWVGLKKRVPVGPHGAPITYIGKGFRLEIYKTYPVTSLGHYRSLLETTIQGQKVEQELHCRSVSVGGVGGLR